MKKIALAALLASAGCASHMKGTAHTVRITDQGGLIRLSGDDLDEAAQAAVKAMKSECDGAFTVTALEDATATPPRILGGNGEYGGMTYVPAVWRDLSYRCGGPGKDSALTARVLAWAAKADAADAAVKAKAEARRRADAPYPCGEWDLCERGGLCIEGTCQQ